MAVLGRLGASVGGLGLLSGPLWVALGRHQAEKWPLLERENDVLILENNQKNMTHFLLSPFTCLLSVGLSIASPAN